MDSKQKQENEKYTAYCEKWMIHQGLGERDLQRKKENDMRIKSVKIKVKSFL
jgi:hypothetical protein